MKRAVYQDLCNGLRPLDPLLLICEVETIQHPERTPTGMRGAYNDRIPLDF